MTMISTSTLKPRTLNGSTGAVDDRAALALDALGTVATEPAPTPDPAPAPAPAPAPVKPRRRTHKELLRTFDDMAAHAVAPEPARTPPPGVSHPPAMAAPFAAGVLKEPSDLELVGQVALAAHAQGLTLQLYVERMTRQLEAVRRVLGGTSR